MKKQIEVCCGSYYDAIQAEVGGALRIELNSALHLGGLTPSVAMLKLTKQNTNVKIMTMVRPRGAGFHYLKEDFETMIIDTKSMIEHGADGIVFGCLTADGEIDIKQSKEMIDIIKTHGKEVIFHRAFDCVKDPFKAIEQLISLGVDRILTSGTYPTVMEGKEILKELQSRYGDKIEILAGCGVNANNARELMEYTGVMQIHSSCKGWLHDETTCGERVNYVYATGEHSSDYECVDAELVKKLIASIQ